MLKRTNSPSVILSYLKSNTYKDLPYGLWDNQLWFYETIQKLLLSTLGNGIPENYHMYTICKGDIIDGIICINITNTCAEVLLDARNNMVLENTIVELKNLYNLELNISVNNLLLANYIKCLTKENYTAGVIKYYTASSSEYKPIYPVIEIKENDKYMYWASDMEEVMSWGIKYFGIVDENKLISKCGICTLTAFKTEIIAVETPLSDYQQKGYAKSLCSTVLNEALKISPFITWTTDISNEKSCLTAKALGFKPFCELYRIKV